MRKGSTGPSRSRTKRRTEGACLAALNQSGTRKAKARTQSAVTKRVTTSRPATDSSSSNSRRTNRSRASAAACRADRKRRANDWMTRQCESERHADIALHTATLSLTIRPHDDFLSHSSNTFGFSSLYLSSVYNMNSAICHNGLIDLLIWDARSIIPVSKEHRNPLLSTDVRRTASLLH